jgi:hypothetical protein
VITSVQSDDARVQSLVAQFVEIGIAQYDAIYVIDNAKYNRSYKNLERIRAELIPVLQLSPNPAAIERKRHDAGGEPS